MITVGAYGRSRAVVERAGTMDDGEERRAGLAAILGGAIFVANLLVYEGLGLAEVTASSSLAATLNNGSLLVAWGLLLWGLFGLRAYGGKATAVSGRRASCSWGSGWLSRRSGSFRRRSPRWSG